MSVFGGDSWGREAQNRKRRVEDLMVEALDASLCKKLCNGRFACLVCPQNPILDSRIMLSMHSKGARHRNALSKLKEKELMKQDEMNKQIALSTNCGTSSQTYKLVNKPLLEQRQNAVSDVLQNRNVKQASGSQICNGNPGNDGVMHVTSSFNRNGYVFVTEESEKTFPQGQLEFQERREKELKFTAAGWKRDCHGKWYKDENVEFDSDEEDPNLCLA